MIFFGIHIIVVESYVSLLFHICSTYTESSFNSIFGLHFSEIISQRLGIHKTFLCKGIGDQAPVFPYVFTSDSFPDIFDIGTGIFLISLLEEG